MSDRDREILRQSQEATVKAVSEGMAVAEENKALRNLLAKKKAATQHLTACLAAMSNSRDEWQARAQTARREALEEAANVAEAYEPECEACPRGVASAIRHLASKAGGGGHGCD